MAQPGKDEDRIIRLVNLRRPRHRDPSTQSAGEPPNRGIPRDTVGGHLPSLCHLARRNCASSGDQWEIPLKTTNKRKGGQYDLGFAHDEELCRRITSATGVPATTATLAFREAAQALGFARIGLVTPYTTDVQDRIRTTWGEAGLHCTAERHLCLSHNFAFARVSEETIGDLVRAVAAEGCDAAAIVCTNLRGAAIAPSLEQELSIPVLDSVAVTLWSSLRLVGADPAALASHGRIFEAA